MIKCEPSVEERVGWAAGPQPGAGAAPHLAANHQIHMEIINVGREPGTLDNINKLGGARRPGPQCRDFHDINNPGPGSWQILIIGAFSIQ